MRIVATATTALPAWLARLHHELASVIRRRAENQRSRRVQEEIEALPDYLKDDIGWTQHRPASKVPPRGAQR